MPGDRVRPSRKIRTWSLILFWLGFALMIALGLGLEGTSGEKIIVVLAFVIGGSGWAYMGCVLYDWWVWFCNKNQG
jgi:4-hydroxybenzoate polyprenyltransferase